MIIYILISGFFFYSVSKIKAQLESICKSVEVGFFSEGKKITSIMFLKKL